MGRRRKNMMNAILVFRGLIYNTSCPADPGESECVAISAMTLSLRPTAVEQRSLVEDRTQQVYASNLQSLRAHQGISDAKEKRSVYVGVPGQIRKQISRKIQKVLRHRK